MTKLTDFEQYVKTCMLYFPSLYPTKESVCDTTFCCVGNGMAWVNDRLKDTVGSFNNLAPAIDANEMDERIAKATLDLSQSSPHMQDYYQARLLQVQAEKIQRDFIFANIDAIVKAPLSIKPMHGKSGLQLSYYTHPNTVSYTYAKMFNYPSKIEKSWALAMLEFINHWVLALNREFGVILCEKKGSGYNDDAFQDGSIRLWPDSAKTLRNRLFQVRAEIYPHAYDGKSYVEHTNSMNRIIEEILSENP